MGNPKDVSGMRFGRLVAISPVSKDEKGNVIWTCKCDCGNITTATVAKLKIGSKKSCGCLAKESAKRQLEINAKRITHGGSKERLYNIYRGIIRRCENPHDSRYSAYGGRGIKMCKEWRDDYAVFRKYALENGYNPTGRYGETTIDRIDVNGDYCPDNCRWVNQTVQQNNKNNNHTLTYNGKTQTIAQWARELQMSANTIMSRVVYGWPVERILTEPVHNNG